ncbi:MAG: iron-containing alcohol dehydrogenase [bacterium]|nr:iron-containing alcohol dehydrogenase [bacterium]
MYQITWNRKLIYGPASLEKVGELAASFGRKALLVTGRNSARQSGILGKVQGFLDSSKVSSVVFNQVSVNPSVKIVDECASLGKENNCDVVIGLGGGSSLDTAKAASVLMTNPGSIKRYLETGAAREKIKTPCLAMIAIPTTAGTGSEITKNAVINDPEQSMKVSVRDDRLVPKAAILDPSLLSTAPKNIIAAAAMDALTQLMEPFTGKNSQPVIDTLALDGIKKINDNIIGFYQDPSDRKAGMDLLLASYYSGLALAHSGLGAVHALSRPFGGLYGLGHGLVCAILLPYITELNCHFNIKKYAEIGIALGLDEKLPEKARAQMVPERIFTLNQNLGIPSDLKQFHLPEKDADRIIQDSQGSSLKNNPREFTREEMKELLLRLI